MKKAGPPPKTRGAPAPNADASPVAPVKKSKKAVWSIGDHVEVFEPHKDGARVWTGSYHAGVIMSILSDGSKVTVEFEPGLTVTVPVEKISRVRGADADSVFRVGQYVDVLYPSLGNSWWQGQIKSITGQNASIKFKSGETQYNIKLTRLRAHQEKQESVFC